MVSRQARWGNKQIALGRCKSCGKPRNHYARLCDQCSVKERIKQRVRRNLSRKVVGKVGRPTKNGDEYKQEEGSN